MNEETPEIYAMSTSYRAITDVEFSKQMGFTHKNDTWWHQAPIPRRWHRCQVWSSGPIRGRVIQRCACGGIRWEDESEWLARNSRRKDKK